jgi:protein-tyrosine phosphatase
MNMEIPDPYGMHLSAYEACRDELVSAIPSIVKFISELPAEVFPKP